MYLPNTRISIWSPKTIQNIGVFIYNPNPETFLQLRFLPKNEQSSIILIQLLHNSKYENHKHLSLSYYTTWDCIELQTVNDLSKKLSHLGSEITTTSQAILYSFIHGSAKINLNRVRAYSIDSQNYFSQ